MVDSLVDVLPDAPTDGNTYVRRGSDRTWQPSSAGGGGTPDTTQDTYIPKKSGTDFVNSALRETDTMVISSKTLQVPPGSIQIGENFTISAGNRCLNIVNGALGLNGVVHPVTFTDAGSDEPVWFDFAAKDTRIRHAGTADQNTGNFNFQYTVVEDRLITQINFDAVNVSTTARVVIRLNSDTGQIIHIQENVTTSVGMNQFVLENPLIFLQSDILNISVENVTVRGTITGSDFFPYFESVGHPFTIYEIVTAKDIESRIYNKIKDDIIAGTGINITPNDGAQQITISSISGGVFLQPQLTGLDLGLGSRVDLNTNLNVAQTVSYNVMHYQNIDGAQPFTLVVSDGDNKTVTVPTSDGAQSESITLSGIDTSTEKTITFQITGTDTQTNSISSNTYSLEVRTLATHEFLLYWQSTTDQLASSVDIGTAGSSETIAGTYQIETYTGSRYHNILVRADQPALTEIIIGSINQIGAYTLNSNARVINSQNYNQYVSNNPLIGSVVSGFNFTLVQ